MSRLLTTTAILFTVLTLLPHRAAASVIIQRPLYVGLSNGLVGYWSFDGDTVFRRSSAKVLDLSGQGNNGTLMNGATTTIGKIGQALQFDAINDCVEYGAVLDNLSPITVSAWINPKSYGKKGASSQDVGDIIEKNLLGGGWTLQVNNFDTTAALTFYRSYSATSLNAYSPANSISLNQWQHVTAVWDGGLNRTNVKFYVNGVFVPTQTGAGTDASGTHDDAGQNFTIGANASDCSVAPIISYLFEGKIDDVRIYNRALSAAEVKRLYKIGGTMTIGKASVTGSLSHGLVGYWSFDGNTVFRRSSAKVLDLSGQGNTGTLTNGATTTIGKIGQALSFDGVNDYVNVGSNVNQAGVMTVTAWIKANSVAAGAMQIVDNVSSGAFQNYTFDLNRTAGKLSTVWGNTVIGTSNTALLTNTWYHVALVRSGTTGNWTAAFYLNGASDGSVTTATNPDISSGSCTTSTFIGTLCSDNDNNFVQFFNGTIDDVRIYNRALSVDEVKRLYSMGRPN